MSAVTSDLALFSALFTETEVDLTVEALIQDALTMVDLAKNEKGGEFVSSEQLQNKCEVVSSTYRSLL